LSYASGPNAVKLLTIPLPSHVAIALSAPDAGETPTTGDNALAKRHRIRACLSSPPVRMPRAHKDRPCPAARDHLTAVGRNTARGRFRILAAHAHPGRRVTNELSRCGDQHRRANVDTNHPRTRVSHQAWTRVRLTAFRNILSS